MNMPHYLNIFLLLLFLASPTHSYFATRSHHTSHCTSQHPAYRATVPLQSLQTYVEDSLGPILPILTTVSFSVLAYRTYYGDVFRLRNCLELVGDIDAGDGGVSLTEGRSSVIVKESPGKGEFAMTCDRKSLLLAPFLTLIPSLISFLLPLQRSWCFLQGLIHTKRGQCRRTIPRRNP